MNQFEDPRRNARAPAQSIPTSVEIDRRFSVPVFATQDEALDVAHRFPAGRALLWDGIDQVTPCYLRAHNGNAQFYVPGFVLQGDSGEALVVALLEADRISTGSILCVTPPPDGRMTVEGLKAGVVEATLLGAGE